MNTTQNTTDTIADLTNDATTYKVLGFSDLPGEEGGWFLAGRPDEDGVYSSFYSLGEVNEAQAVEIVKAAGYEVDHTEHDTGFGVTIEHHLVCRDLHDMNTGKRIGRATAAQIVASAEDPHGGAFIVDEDGHPVDASSSWGVRSVYVA